MSLRGRLLVTVLALVALGLLVMGGATFGALQDWRSERDDGLLAATAESVESELGIQSGPHPLGAATQSGNLGEVWQRVAAQGDVPSFFQLRGADGRALETVALDAQPALPAVLPPSLIPDRRDVRWARIATAAPGGETSPGWRVLLRRVPDGDEILITGLRTATSDDLLGRTVNVMVGTGAAVLLGVAVLSLHGIRCALRPLDNIAATADAIGAGDLSLRVHDVSPRTEVGRLGAALNIMLGQIETAFRARKNSEDRLRQFVADASHELRTPIATIRGYAELFRRGAAQRPDDLADAMRRIESEGARMGGLVDELLLLARLDQGRPLDREPVDLTALAVDAVADARAVDPSAPLHVDCPTSVHVIGDAARLRQVLDNLLSNVRQHTPPGTPATVKVRVVSEHAVVEVSDSGPGLTQQQRQLVFERFYRIDDSRRRRGSGSGLGLSIVAAVARAHGGAAEALPSPAGGTSFRIYLPRDPEAAPRNLSRRANETPASAGSRT